MNNSLQAMKIVMGPVDKLALYARNPRKNEAAADCIYRGTA